MNSIFRKTLVAAAVMGMASANAATITAWNNTAGAVWSSTEVAANGSTLGTGAAFPLVSAEGYAIAKSIGVNSTAGQLGARWTAGVAYSVGDLITLTVSNATIATASSNPTMTLASGAGAIGLLNEAAGSVTFRVTTAVTAGSTFTIGGLVLTGASGAVSLSTVGTITGSSTNFDASKTTTVGMVASEFTVGAGDHKLNAVIDVEKARKQFTSTSTSTTADLLTYDIEAGADLMQVNYTTPVVTLKGSDLSWLLDKDGKLESSNYNLASATDTALSVDTAADKTFLNTAQTEFKVTATEAYTTTGANDVQLTLTVDGAADANAQVLAAQSFTADMALGYAFNGTPATTDSLAVNGLAAGAWTLSGKTVNIPFMPYGSGISQIIHVSNDGNVSGDIELTAFDDSGQSYGPVSLSLTATAKTVTRLNGAIRTALTDAGFDGIGNLDITLVINSPSADIEVFAAYNVRGDRVGVTVQ